MLRVGPCQPLWAGHRSVASLSRPRTRRKSRYLMRLLGSPDRRGDPEHLDVWDHRSSGRARDGTCVKAVAVFLRLAIVQSRAHDTHGLGADRGT